MDTLQPTNQSVLVSAGYILGVGTNLEPEKNAALIVAHLAERFGRVLVSRFYYTDPVGIMSRHRFVNFCAFVPSDLEPTACKAVCVGIEVAMGRDRAHPACKTRDRPADIDLVGRLSMATLRADLGALSPDAYLADPCREIAAMLTGRGIPEPAGELCVVPGPGSGSCRLGETPAAVHRDDRAGLVVVPENGVHGHPDRLDPALLAEQGL